MTQPVFDPAMFGGRPSPPPIPMVVCWDDLDPNAYGHQLTDLAAWITWFRGTYRIPATVLPPCWFTHPAIREDIGHLWIGWLLTRHPDAGVGMIGLDWDQRRDAAIHRLREATAITGCTATRHQPEPDPAGPASVAVDQLWNEHLEAQTRQRTHAIALQTVRDIVTEILQAAELRHDLAPAILAEIVADLSTAVEQRVEAVTERLHQLAVDALDRAADAANDAAATIDDALQRASLESTVLDARDDIVNSIASSALNGDTSGIPFEQTLSAVWLDALEQLLPAVIAAQRATAAASARSAAVDQRANARRRHPGVDGILE